MNNSLIAEIDKKQWSGLIRQLLKKLNNVMIKQNIIFL